MWKDQDIPYKNWVHPKIKKLIQTIEEFFTLPHVFLDESQRNCASAIVQ